MPWQRFIIAFGIVALAGFGLALLARTPSTYLPAINGAADLRWWKPGQDDPVKIGGTWQFFPNRQLSPLDFTNAQGQAITPEGAIAIKVPGLWSNYHGQQQKGVATWSLKILLKEKTSTNLALLYSQGFGSIKIYINGKLEAKSGIVSDRQSEFQNGSPVRILPIATNESQIHIIVQSSNFEEPHPGIWNELIFGSSQSINNIFLLGLSYDIAILAASWILAMYLLIFFLFKSTEKSLLFIAFFAMALSARQVFLHASNMEVFLPWLGFQASYSIPAILLFAGATSFVWYLFVSFPSFINKKIVIAHGLLSAGMLIAAIIFTKEIFALALPVYFIIMLGMFVYLTYALVRAGIKKQSSAWLQLTAMYALVFSFSQELYSSIAIVNAITSMGTVIVLYMLLHAILFSWRFVEGFEKSVDLSAELKRLLAKQDLVHENLERTVIERTRDLSKALDIATRANSAKSRFLANVSHEIRTPLNGIIGFTELLKDKPDSPSRNHFYQLILSEANRLQSLIDQLLDFSKIEANKLVLENQVFDVQEMFQTISATMQLRTQASDISFSMFIDDKIPKNLRGDPMRLRQVIDNLLSNSLKFTEQGSINLHARMKYRIPEKLTLEFTIQDTGIGIPRERQQKIFEGFEQGDSSTTRLYGGTGLGTTIAKQLVELMGGSISLSSEPGKGTSFLFTAQLGLPAEHETTTIHISDQHSEPRWQDYPVVILAEDYRVNAELVMRHMVSCGWVVRQATNGQEAVAIFNREKTDLILMDIQMPLMDGYEATRIIRSTASWHIPILGLSANAFEEDRLRCLEVGMDTLVSKPVRRHVLLETIAQYIPPQQWVQIQDTSSNAEVGKPSMIKDNRLLDELDGDIIDYITMAEGFAHELQQNLPVLEKALAQGDILTVHRISHGIKGAAMNLGSKRLEEVSKKVETAAKTGTLVQESQAIEDFMAAIRRITSHFFNSSTS